MNSIRALMVVFSLVFFAACDDDLTSPTYVDRPFCPSPLALEVSAGTQPTFSWAVECRVWALRVERVSDGQVQWNVGKDDESLSSPVNYGVAPAGAGQSQSPRALATGTQYRALLVQRSNGGRVISERTFTP